MKRITTILVLALLLLLPAVPSTTAQPTPTPADAVAPQPHINEGDIEKWKDDPDTYGYGFQHFVWICTVGYSAPGAEQRVIDAANEWNEIGGEYALSWAGEIWTDQECLNQFNGTDSVVMVTGASITSGPIAQSYPQCPLDPGCDWAWSKIDDCDIYLDMDGILESQGNASFSWYLGTGSPSSSQVDLESVVVHELGHCLGITGHSTHYGPYVMHNTLNPTGGDPRGVEKDETWSHDKDLYIGIYGNTH